MIKKLVSLFFILGIILFHVPAHSMNFLRPYDTLIRPEIYLDQDKPFRLAFWAERGIHHAKAFGECGETSVLGIYNGGQDALAMLDGFCPESEIGKLRIALDAADDGIRGHFCVDGKLKLDYSGAFSAQWLFADGIWVAFYLPYMKMQLENVSFIDQTRRVTAADIRTHQLLTDELPERVRELGCLDIGPWKRQGIGDAVLMLEWLKHYPQMRPMLKDVYLNGRLGLNTPTGKRVDPDLLMALPFGYDGSWGLIFGGGLGVTLGRYLKAGFDVELVQLFGNTRDRRIKTARDQTELLLLAKADAYTDFGLMQRFNIFIQGYHLIGGFSALVGYEFRKRGENELILTGCCFNNRVANSAASLLEWTAHQAIVNLHYDFRVHQCDDASVAPQLSFFARLPFNGKRSILFTTVGIMGAIDF